MTDRTATAEDDNYREPIHIGGLMRCCLQTLHERTVRATEGEFQPCRWCSGGAVFRDGAWRWPGRKAAP